MNLKANRPELDAAHLVIRSEAGEKFDFLRFCGHAVQVTLRVRTGFERRPLGTPTRPFSALCSRRY